MGQHVTRRPMPVEQSVHWKPLHDSHYVVASLQPGEGGRRSIFVRQQMLSRVETLVRSSHGRHIFGLMLGQFYSCPNTGLDYVVIESLLEHHPASDDDEVAARIAASVREWQDERRAHILGWYCGAATARPSASTAEIHDAYFAQPWQTAVVIGAAAGSANGAFYLHDRLNARWFHAPFYELLDHAPSPSQPKPTCITWSDYMTADPVAPMVPEQSAPISAPADARSEEPHHGSRFLRPKTREHGEQAPSPHHSIAEAVVSPLARLRERIVLREPVVDAPADRTSTATNAGLSPRAQDGSADVDAAREKVLARLTDRPPDRIEVVDDRDPRASASRTTRRISDSDDTVLGDTVSRFIEIARADGFFVAAQFEAAGETPEREMLWILNDPFSGMLLVVAAAGEEVLDASIHYNVRTDDTGLLRTPFPEHRDADSKTVYVREPCVEGLRERCRQLRATDMLVREWKVSPTIPFVLPSEWQAIAAASAVGHGGPAMVNELNDSRIAELPDGVRSQFHLAKVVDAQP